MVGIKCIGCGEVKQTISQKQKGFVKKEDDAYCLRCFRIKNYNDLIEQDLEPEKFGPMIEQEIKNNKNKKTFYYVLDILDLQGSRSLELERIIGKHEVVLVINKIDLIPKAVKLAKIRKYIEQTFSKTSLNQARIILTNVYKKPFIISLLNIVLKNRNDQYFVGQSNVGKTSLLNAMMIENKLIPTVVGSKFFNTTLNLINISLAPTINVFDTPGIKKTGSIAQLTNDSDWKYFYFKKELKQTTFQLSPNNSIVWANLCWFTYDNNFDTKINFHFYANQDLNLHRTKQTNEVNFIKKNPMSPTIKAPFTFDEIATTVIELSQGEVGQKLDIVISGLGWINCQIEPGTKLSISYPNKVKLNIYKRSTLI